MEILYEDEVVLVANKPAGLPCQNTDNPSKRHFYGMLCEYLNGGYLAIHHRLDAQTSGVMLFSKSKKYNKEFTDLFRNRVIKKSYLALVWSRKECPDQWSEESPLKKVRRGRHLISVIDYNNGQPATSQFKKIWQKGEKTLLECVPETGRMHQLRVHLAANQMPVGGDWVYGKKNDGYSRMMLHAWKLAFPHPATGKFLDFEAPIPLEFQVNHED